MKDRINTNTLDGVVDEYGSFMGSHSSSDLLELKNEPLNVSPTDSDYQGPASSSTSVSPVTPSTHQPYRPILPKDSYLLMLSKMADTHFNPDMLRSYLNLENPGVQHAYDQVKTAHDRLNASKRRLDNAKHELAAAQDGPAIVDMNKLAEQYNTQAARMEHEAAEICRAVDAHKRTRYLR